MRRLITDGRLEAFNVGRQLRVPATKLSAFIESGCAGKKAAKRSLAPGLVLQ